MRVFHFAVFDIGKTDLVGEARVIISLKTILVLISK